MRRYFESTDMLCVDLKKFELFKDLRESELEEIEKKFNIVKLKKNSVVYREGCNVGGIYIVISGIIKIYKTGYEGKEQIVRFACNGEPVGFRSLITDEPACSTSEALVETVLCYIPGEEMLFLFKNNPEFAMTLLKIACDELGAANQFILHLSQLTVRERLAEVIIHLMKKFDLDEEHRLRIALTREDLANLVGTATESVIRLLSEFKTDNLIEVQGRYIKILDAPTLAKVANIVL